jgi:hypothetical protein
MLVEVWFKDPVEELPQRARIGDQAIEVGVEVEGGSTSQ